MGAELLRVSGSRRFAAFRGPAEVWPPLVSEIPGFRGLFFPFERGTASWVGISSVAVGQLGKDTEACSELRS